MGIRVEETTFHEWQRAYRVRLGSAEMVVVTDIGPRILSLSVGDGPNLLFVDSEMKIGLGGGESAWHIYGGHRVWVAPETRDTYAPDNAVCEAEMTAGRLSVVAPVAPQTGLRKRLSIGACGERFVLRHVIENCGEALYSGAAWALTCVAPEGVVAFPWGQGGSWDLKKIVYWNRWMDHRSDVSSQQWQPGPDLFRVVPTGEEGKVGTNSPEGWVALCRKDATFIKARQWAPAAYPDDNCSLQVYTCGDFIELETLGPLATLYPGSEMVHEEVWTVTSQVVDPSEGDTLRRVAGL